MNERIKLLAEQAGIQMFEDRAFGWSVIAGTDHNVQRFVELIVQECFDVVINDGRFHDAKGIIQAGKGVAMEHFGVEE